MIERGDYVNREKLNSLVSETAGKIHVVGGGKVIPNSNPYINQVVISGAGGFGGGILVQFVARLPRIDKNSRRPRFVFWCSRETGLEVLGEEGTGDDQVWAWWPMSPYYIPMQRYTMKSGFPESI